MSDQTNVRECCTEAQMKIIDDFTKIAPKYSSIDMINNGNKPLIYEFENLKADFDERLEKCNNSLFDKRVLYEGELKIVLCEIQNLPTFVMFMTNNDNLKQYVGEEDFEIFRRYCDSFDLFGSTNELNKYNTYLEIAYQDLANGTYHLTESDLQEYTNRMILQYIEDNKLVSQLDTISIPYAKHKLTLEYVLKRFVEQNINKQVEAEVLLELFDFLHTEYSYPRDRTEEVERALEAKVNFCNNNSSKDEDEFMNKKEIAEFINVSDTTITNWMKIHDDLPCSKPGKAYVFNKREFMSWYYSKNQL